MSIFESVRMAFEAGKIHAHDVKPSHPLSTLFARRWHNILHLTSNRHQNSERIEDAVRQLHYFIRGQLDLRWHFRIRR